MHQVLRLGSTQYNIWIPVHSLLHVYTTTYERTLFPLHVCGLGALSIYRLGLYTARPPPSQRTALRLL